MKKILGIIGLGYVGLPLAIEFSKKRRVIAFDNDQEKISKLKKKNFFYKATHNENDLEACQIFLVTVPTPIDKFKKPDLSHLKSACEIVGRNISKNSIVVFESTVYPGCTEEFCAPIIEKKSGLIYNRDFYCGYSPERINPGDNSHTLTKINKLVSGSNKKICFELKTLYEEIIKKKIFTTETIKIAESAKVIENTQRDLNIALINEFAMILNKLNIDTKKVIEAASTKWNFHPFKAGLVGGHCVGVDPYYLTYKAKKIGINPKIILAGRSINDGMGKYIFTEVKKITSKKKIRIKNSKVLILGFAFKENCEDIRNTKVIDIIKYFKPYNSRVDIFDPLVNENLLKKMYRLNLTKKLKKNFYDIIIYAVPHKKIRSISLKKIKNCGKKNRVIYDVKSIFPKNLTDGSL